MESTVTINKHALAQRIAASNFTLPALASQLGIKKRSLMYLLTNRHTMRLSTLVRLTSALGIPHSDFIDWDKSLACSSGPARELRRYRLMNGLIMEECADRLSMTVPHLRALEYGYWLPREKVAKRIYDVTGIVFPAYAAASSGQDS